MWAQISSISPPEPLLQSLPGIAEELENVYRRVKGRRFWFRKKTAEEIVDTVDGYHELLKALPTNKEWRGEEKGQDENSKAYEYASCKATIHGGVVVCLSAAPILAKRHPQRQDRELPQRY